MLQAIRKTIGGLLGFQDAVAVAAPSAKDKVLAEWQERFLRIKASYDATRTSDEFKNTWANADSYDADSAHSKGVRHTAIARSRYEIGNNGYADGIAQTYATDLVGIGPTLRMQTGSEGFNRMVELSWHLWTKAVSFRRKLWCMAHAKHQDGETFGVLRRNPGVNHPIKLDLCLYEAEQVQTPYLPFATPGYIDGIQFDKFGNPEWYDLLLEHPGSVHRFKIDLTPERVPAAAMLHWFKMRRPGQHRAMPECISTLNTGAAARRWREATLTTAERAALQSLMMETPMTPDEADEVAPFTTMDIEKGMMTFLPMGWKPNQLEGKFPTSNHGEFHRSLISEQARPKAMPYNRAAADSSGHNFASGKLDFMPYFEALDVDREDCNELVLDKTFDTWFDFTVRRFGWLGGSPEAIGPAARLRFWDWPKRRVADVVAEAEANDIKLKTGQIFPHTLFTDAGLDFEDELEKAAASYGISVDEMRKRLLDVILPPVQQGGAPGQQSPSDQEPADQAVAAMLASLQKRNGHENGVHANGN